MQRPENPPRSVGASSLTVLFPPCRVEHESTSPWLMGMMWCDPVVFLVLVSLIYPSVPGTMHEGRNVLISFDQMRRRTVTPIHLVRSFVPLTTSGLVLSKLDSPGGDVEGYSSEALMIQM